jgi:antibiotic biosynthesis monooxygenase (ABM) superfamily enzyme
MGGEDQDGEQASEATVVVNIKINPGCEKDYDEWLRRFLVIIKRKCLVTWEQQRSWKQPKIQL